MTTTVHEWTGFVLQFSTSSTNVFLPLISVCSQEKETELKQQSFEILRNPYLRKLKKKVENAKKINYIHSTMKLHI